MQKWLLGLMVFSAIAVADTAATLGQPIHTCSCEFTGGNPNDNTCWVEQKVYTQEGRFLSANVISSLFPCPQCTAMLQQLYWQCH